MSCLALFRTSLAVSSFVFACLSFVFPGSQLSRALITQTKLSLTHSGAEVSFYGPIERETMEALQACTFAALQTVWEASASPVAFWRPSPFSSHVVYVTPPSFSFVLLES